MGLMSFISVTSDTGISFTFNCRPALVTRPMKIVKGDDEIRVELGNT